MHASCLFKFFLTEAQTVLMENPDCLRHFHRHLPYREANEAFTA